jgi:hypothetical protein
VLCLLKSEIEKTRRGEKSEMLDTLIAYEWHSMFGGFTRDHGTLKRPTS